MSQSFGTTFFGYCEDAKKKHPDKVILVRNGKFYETFGIDSLMLMGERPIPFFTY
jgi:DNA mismatch repair ATPase MutS